MNILRKIRISLALIFISIITLLFLDYSGTIHAWFGWMAKIQFLPAILSINVGIITLWVVLTLLFGRIYCSVICPLGIFQDFISWISMQRKTKKNRFLYSPALNWLRYGVLVLFIIAMIAGIGSIVALLAPYSSYGRIISNLISPIYLWINNLNAHFAESMNSYAFYSVDIWLKSLPTFIIAAVTLIVVIVLAWRDGRTYCNTICPVGTFLGVLSKFSLFRPVIDTTKCNHCGLCSKKCKASCINPADHTIDYTRCIACMDCLDNCQHGSIRYRLHIKQQASENIINAPTDKGRREMLAVSAALFTAATLKAETKKVDGGLAFIEDKKIPERQTPIVPAGARSQRNFYNHCTGCQLCVSVCPNQVLRPSANLTTLMQPEMSYERGYCRPECTKCTEVCPTGAILPITKIDKSSIQIGHAVWIEKNCVVLTDEVSCGNCARHCPVGAISMVSQNPKDELSRKIPVINTERCIGCGACENLCPARPFSAIYVEGHETHRIV